MKKQNFIFTSESVGEGHPDKICDQISDAVLDEAISIDKESRVACETFITTGMVLVGGEITTNGYIDVSKIVKGVLKKIGYNNSSYGIDYNSCSILSVIHEQSLDIAMGVNSNKNKKQGAGDQGMMFGYACSDTLCLMPAPIYYAHEIMRRASVVRKNRILKFLRPDGKCQVSFKYENGVPKEITSIVLSQQHNPIKYSILKEALIEEVIKKIIPPEYLKNAIYHINPTGRFVIGGPQGDTGLTGRKIIVDTYGGMGGHGGGAFSGKDPSKVDRSGAYIARHIAKNIVASQIAKKCEIQISYAIGISDPISIFVNTFGTSIFEEDRIEKAIRKVYDLTPAGVIDFLDLKKPIYQNTATYGHFGSSNFSWEQLDKGKQLLGEI